MLKSNSPMAHDASALAKNSLQEWKKMISANKDDDVIGLIERLNLDAGMAMISAIYSRRWKLLRTLKSSVKSGKRYSENCSYSHGVNEEKLSRGSPLDTERAEVSAIFSRYNEACKNGSVDKLLKLEKRHGVPLLSTSPTSLLVAGFACEHGNKEILKFLLERGQCPNAVHGGKFSLLHCAIRHPDCLELLIDYGADLDAVYVSQNESPLQYALRLQFADSARMFIRRGADVNVNRANKGMKDTPLHAAICWGDYAIVKEIIDAGADVNAKPYGLTAIQEAAVAVRNDLVQLLLDNGAEFSADVSYSESLYSVAIARYGDSSVDHVLKYIESLDMKSKVSVSRVKSCDRRCDLGVGL